MFNEASVEIDRPIGEVFDYTIHHVPDWSITVVEDVPIDVKPEGVGSTFRCVTEDRGRRMEFAGVVTRHEPPTVSAVYLTGDCFDIDVVYLFEDLGGSTRVTQQSDVTGKGMTKVVFFLFGWMMKKSGCDAVDNELLSLKQKLESREVGAAD